MRSQTKGNFHPDTILAKRRMRLLRVKNNLTVYKGAQMVGVTRKQMEDIEATRPYGCYVDWLMVMEYCEAYGVTPDYFAKPLNDKEMELLKITGERLYKPSGQK